MAKNKGSTIASMPATVRFQSTLPKPEPQLRVLAVGIDTFVGVDGLINLFSSFAPQAFAAN